MKLKKVTVNDPVERLAVSVRQSTTQMIAAYMAHYEAVYGERIEKSQLVEEIIRDYIAADKDFAKKQAGADKAAAKAAKAPKDAAQA